jgi:excisionase family DNA binding protein
MLTIAGNKCTPRPSPSGRRPPVLFEGRLGCSIDETATALGVQRDTVYRLIAEDRLTVSKLGRRTIVHVASIQRLLDETVIRPKPRVRRHRSGAPAGGPDCVPARHAAAAR